jgi:hypothetical protein
LLRDRTAWRAVKRAIVGCRCRGSSPRQLAERSPLHDVRQPAPRRSRIGAAQDQIHGRVRKAVMGCRGPPALGGARRNRTDDLLLAKQALSQLSYGPERQLAAKRRLVRMVGLGRFELPTSRLSSARSNQLSYKPKTFASRETHLPASLNDRPTRRSAGCGPRAARARP